MEFKEIIRMRRSVRKFKAEPVPRAVVERLLAAALSAPSSRNTRSTRFLVVDDPAAVARMAGMRDYGAGFMKGAPLAVVVLGETAKADLWRENCAIAATLLQLACVDEGLASCWVHVDGARGSRMPPTGKWRPIICGVFCPFPTAANLCAPSLWVIPISFPRPCPRPTTRQG